MRKENTFCFNLLKMDVLNLLYIVHILNSDLEKVRLLLSYAKKRVVISNVYCTCTYRTLIMEKLYKSF